MQTSIEWLEEQIIKFHKWKLNPIHDENCFDEIELDKAIKKAKKMHKIEIMKAYSKQSPIEDGVFTSVNKAEQYYNQKYKQ
jgi:hypothetical protein